MQDKPALRDPFVYSHWWLWVGLACLVAVVCWYGFVFFYTRKKRPNQLHLQKLVEPRNVDLTRLRKKYLALIDEVEALHNSQQMTKRAAYQKLSNLVRFFVYEASGFKAHVMTLLDLTLSRYPDLAKTIESYYPTEFDIKDYGSVQDAASAARKVVTTWS